MRGQSRPCVGDGVRGLRADWRHTEKSGRQADAVTAEVEKSFGLLTVEFEVPYEREVIRGIDPTTSVPFRDRSEGIASIEIAARHPLFQVVSQDGRIDY